MRRALARRRPPRAHLQPRPRHLAERAHRKCRLPGRDRAPAQPEECLKPVHPDAVLLLGFGSPASLEGLPGVFSRGPGRAPSARMGGSPFREISQRQAEALQARLKRKGHALPVALAFLHSPPTIRETVNRLAGQAVRRLIGLPLAAHASPLSTRAYAQATVKALKDCGQPITFIMIPPSYEYLLFLA